MHAMLRISVFVVFLMLHAGQAHALVPEMLPESRAQMQLSFAPLVKRTSPAVANIYTKRIVKEQMRVISPFFNDPFFNQFFGMQGLGNGGVRERVESSLGSGVIVDTSGIVATNTHVIKGASEITAVTSDGREFSAEVMLVDEKTDLAVLRLQTKGDVLPYLELADSDALEVGDLVLAIGNPFGVGQTVTSGIVSALARTGVGAVDYGYFIQTDAAINPGNSGGALVDMQGRLVGINSMIFSKTGGSMGIGFAIPSSMLQAVLTAAKSGKKLVRPWTGFTGQSVSPDMVESLGLKRAYGVLVNKVVAGGPAEKAGLKVGDIIVRINAKDVQDPEALQFRLATLTIDSNVTLGVLRNGKGVDLTMHTVAPPEVPKRDTFDIKGNNPFGGAVVENISPAVAQEMGGIEADSGVIVTAVTGGYAARLGVQVGDVIKAVNNKPINAVSDLREILKKQANSWTFQIMRNGQVISMSVRG